MRVYNRCQHERGICGTARQVDRRRDFTARTDNVDDYPGPMFPHTFHHRVYDVDIGEIFRVHRRAPIGGREFLGRSALRYTRRIDQNIEHTEFTVEAFEHSGCIGLIGKVRDEADRPGQKARRRIDIGRISRADGNARTFGEKGMSASEPDPLLSAFHQNAFFSKTELHSYLQYKMDE